MNKKHRNSEKYKEISLDDLFSPEDKQISIAKKSKLGPLIVVDDLVPLEMFDEGYVIAKRARSFINGEWHDVALGHSYNLVDKGFYSIPIMSVTLENDEEIFQEITKNAKDFQRYFVWTQKNNKPYLIERIGDLCFYTSYSITNFQTLSKSKQGRLFMHCIKGLARKLSSLF